MELVGAVVAEKASDGWIANIAPHEDMQPVMELDVTVTCSAGTYIRALARDLGEELGLGGHLTMLRRTRVGRFSVNMPNVMSAHAESKTFTNREGMEVTRNRAGIADDKIILDPGVGFGKTYEMNLMTMDNLELFRKLGYPVLLGTSRKSMIGLALDLPVDQRVEGTLATSVIGVMKGCAFVRVHDIKENKRVIQMTEAILGRR